MKRSFYFSVLLLAGTVLAANEAELPLNTVAVSAAVEAEDRQMRHYTGLVISPAVINLVARVAGEISEVNFQDGALVKAGQVLYRIDPVQYEAAVKVAEANIARCRAELGYAKSNFNRIDTLERSSAASKDSAERSLSALQVCQANLLAAEAALITANDNLKSTVICTPISGAIGVTNFTRGNYVSLDSGVLVKVIQTDPVRVRFSISNRDFLSGFGSPEKFKAAASIRIRLADGSWYPVEGDAELINNEANRNTDTLQVYVKFANPDRKLVSGSSVTVVLTRKDAPKLPVIPPSALMYEKNSSYVYVLAEGNKIEKRTVVAGNSTSATQFIVSGLKAGERVVSGGNHKVIPGETVNPID